MQPLCGDFGAAIGAQAVAAVSQPRQGLVDLAQLDSIAVGAGEVQFSLGVMLGGIVAILHQQVAGVFDSANTFEVTALLTRQDFTSGTQIGFNPLFILIF